MNLDDLALKAAELLLAPPTPAVAPKPAAKPAYRTRRTVVKEVVRNSETQRIDHVIEHYIEEHVAPCEPGCRHQQMMRRKPEPVAKLKSVADAEAYDKLHPIVSLLPTYKRADEPEQFRTPEPLDPADQMDLGIFGEPEIRLSPDEIAKLKAQP